MILIGLAARATIAKEIAAEGRVMREVVNVVWKNINRVIGLICQGTLVLQVCVMRSEIRYLEIVLSVIQPITCASLL